MILRITVITSDGGVHQHDYENTPEKQSEADQLFTDWMTIISQQAGGAILMSNPIAIYNPAHVIRVSQSIVEED